VIVPCADCTLTSPCMNDPDEACWSRRNRREALGTIAAGLESLRRRAVDISVDGEPKLVASIERAEALIAEAAKLLRRGAT
jgi:hypothetical protein